MYLLCYFFKLIGTGARQGGGVDSGIRFRGDSESIRRCRPFPVHVTVAKGRRRRRKEGTGRKGGGENNTGVYRQSLMMEQWCPNKSRAPPPWIPMGSPSRRR